eukprot:1159551-Pelagomonas_calceolata.AAC.4
MGGRRRLKGSSVGVRRMCSANNLEGVWFGDCVGSRGVLSECEGRVRQGNATVIAQVLLPVPPCVLPCGSAQ